MQVIDRQDPQFNTTEKSKIDFTGNFQSQSNLSWLKIKDASIFNATNYHIQARSYSPRRFLMFDSLILNHSDSPQTKSFLENLLGGSCDSTFFIHFKCRNRH